MILNGEKVNIAKKTSVYELMSEKGFDISRSAVELNGEIIDKSRLNDVFLTEADVMEVVTFMGGG